MWPQRRQRSHIRCFCESTDVWETSRFPCNPFFNRLLNGSKPTWQGRGRFHGGRIARTGAVSLAYPELFARTPQLCTGGRQLLPLDNRAENRFFYTLMEFPFLLCDGARRMAIEDLLMRTRSYRRFSPNRPLDERTLYQLVELTRLCPSSANRQPLKYAVYWESEDNARIFPHLAWAAALPDWPGPAEGERPTGYILILGDTEISTSFNVDPGIVAQSILLAATERGLGGCLIGSINRDALREELNIPSRYAILLVVALGEPTETVVLEDAESPSEINYWRDENDVHHVPKRTMYEILLKFD